MFKLHEAQQKRIVFLASAALVFAMFAIYQLFVVLGSNQGDRDLVGSSSPVFQISCVVLMAMAITYILIRSLYDHKTLKYLHMVDQKTKLPNAHALEKQMDGLLKGKSGDASTEFGSFSLMVIDIDRLKSINQSLGHEGGDNVILEVSCRLKKLFGSLHRVYKLEGGRFGLLQSNVSDQEWIKSTSDEVFELMSHVFELEGSDLYLDVSVGSCLVSDGSIGTNEVLRRAEFSLSQAKKQGGNCLVMYDEGVSRSEKDQSTFEHDFREALETGAIEFVYQPLISSRTGRIGGVEALARWNHNDRGYVSPSVFVPIAAKLKLINKLGEQSLRLACESAKQLDQLKMSVNISPDHFLSDGFVETVCDILKESGLPAERLDLEITEDVLLGESQKALDVMASLKEVGVGISLDDFGAGYSGLSYMHQYKVDRLKIDAVFVKELETSASSQVMVKTIAQLAKLNGFQVVVEGVETEGQRQFLSQFPDIWYQGYLFSKPLTLDDLLQSDLLNEDALSAFQQGKQLQNKLKVVNG